MRKCSMCGERKPEKSGTQYIDGWACGDCINENEVMDEVNFP